MHVYYRMELHSIVNQIQQHQGYDDNSDLRVPQTREVKGLEELFKKKAKKTDAI